MNLIRAALGGLLAVSLATGCGGSAASGTPDGVSTSPGPTAVPGDPGTGAGTSGGGSGSGTGGNAGSVDIPPPNPAPGDDGATIVQPKPGQLDPSPVSVSGLIVKAEGRHVTVRLAWTSGVEPCYVLDAVKVVTDASTITLTVLEGHGPGDNICIEIAQLKATVVDLGELEPGTWLIQAQPGDAPAQTIEIV